MKAVEETMINEDTGVVQQLMLNNYHIVRCFELFYPFIMYISTWER